MCKNNSKPVYLKKTKNSHLSATRYAPTAHQRLLVYLYIKKNKKNPTLLINLTKVR